MPPTLIDVVTTAVGAAQDGESYPIHAIRMFRSLHCDRRQSSTVSLSSAAKYGVFGSLPNSWRVHQVAHEFDEHQGDGVDRLMPVEARRP